MSGKQEIIKSMIGGGHDVLVIWRQKTKADRIRQMSDEELARYYAKRIARCYGCEAVTEDNCFECQMYWLKRPVDKEEEG